MSDFKCHDNVGIPRVRDLLQQVAKREMTVDEALQLLRTPALLAQMMSDFTGDVEFTIYGFDECSYWEEEAIRTGPSRQWVSPLRADDFTRPNFSPNAPFTFRQRSALWADATAPQLITSEEPDEVWVGIDCVGEGTRDFDARGKQEKYVIGASLKLHKKATSMPSITHS